MGWKGYTASFSLDLDVGSLSGWVNDNLPVELCSPFPGSVCLEGSWFPAVFVKSLRPEMSAVRVVNARRIYSPRQHDACSSVTPAKPEQIDCPNCGPIWNGHRC